MFEAALEAGASEVDTADDGHEVLCAPQDFNAVRGALEDRFAAAESAALAWRPQTTVDLDEDGAAALFKLLEALEDNDDVQSIAANFNLAQGAAAKPGM